MAELRLSVDQLQSTLSRPSGIPKADLRRNEPGAVTQWLTVNMTSKRNTDGVPCRNRSCCASTGDRLARNRLVLVPIVLATCVGLFGLARTADAQPTATPRRIGVLLVARMIEHRDVQAFRQGLLDAGDVEGRDVAIQWRSANGDYARIPELAADLVERKVDVIVVEGTLATQAVKRATSTIPIVMAVVADPVGSGLVPASRIPVKT